MALMTAKEFLAHHEASREAYAAQVHEEQQREDEYHAALGELVEEHPVINPHLVLERRARGIG